MKWTGPLKTSSGEPNASDNFPALPTSPTFLSADIPEEVKEEGYKDFVHSVTVLNMIFPL